MREAGLVVVGAALAGLRAATAARRTGYDGPVTLVGAEPHLPYDRPPLSKAFLADPDYAPPTLTDTGALSSLIIATGSAPVSLPFGGHTLRTLDDARAIRDRLPTAERAIIIGGGFIGAEMASALAGLHRRNDVDLRCGTTVQSVDSTKVRLSDGSVLDADLVIVGIGARPALDWLADSGLTLEDGVLCAAPGIDAAGDAARWHNPLFDATMRLENWTSATAQAEAAARNAVGPVASPFSTVPYFWSDWYGNQIQMVGVVTDDVTLLGCPGDESWLALYRAGDRLAGALALNQSGRIMKYRNQITRHAAWQDALKLATAR
ncbi:FAD-dependent oxidoreductase [Amycolatopsis rubida]|uniref:FAD-dependent oxidoreductase n=1 Tax=Amycolatopsis rubida TaxID=112413 RepID=A0ABX0BQQ3_9PSEU|nr:MULTISPECIES: FAD-dependent oxidoreductase [Amycolatopsis]MYW90188.1 FAD-dependent oxidoreductase [Amycolatopsis rubida]NEC55165.1 FAD-dependent oxidoreductase [Amycolatopsis rubida]OAP28549.1 Putidaredoxin reductase [Amycolatopsis sp. M39]